AKAKRPPKIAVILGSGLGALARDVTDGTGIPYGEIPGFQKSTAPGHAGELVVGTLSGKDVAIMNGRLHYYEGYDIAAIGFPVRVLGAWGVRTMIITNSCGASNDAGIRRGCRGHEHGARGPGRATHGDADPRDRDGHRHGHWHPRSDRARHR